MDNKVEVSVESHRLIPEHETHNLERIVLRSGGDSYQEIEIFKEEVDTAPTGEEIGNVRTSLGLFHIEDLQHALKVMSSAVRHPEYGEDEDYPF